MQPNELDFDPHAHLDPLADRFDALGLADIARRLRHLGADQRPPAVDTADLIGLGEAATLLGLRSPSTVRDLVAQGLLEGRRHADTVLVSRASVDHLLGSPTLQRTRRVEEQLWLLLGDGEAA
jgi:hypothetical protein